MPPNIEKSHFRKGEYVGYANGVWKIRKYYGNDNRNIRQWIAVKDCKSVFGRTLKEISEKIKVP